jgi:hypothetical protein
MIFFLPALAVAVIIAGVVLLLAIALVAGGESTWEDKEIKTISRERRRRTGSGWSPREGDYPHQRHLPSSR